MWQTSHYGTLNINSVILRFSWIHLLVHTFSFPINVIYPILIFSCRFSYVVVFFYTIAMVFLLFYGILVIVVTSKIMFSTVVNMSTAREINIHIKKNDYHFERSYKIPFPILHIIYCI